MLQPKISCRALSGIFLMKDGNTTVCGGDFSQQIRCAVCRAIINNNDFYICMTLIQNGREASLNIRLNIIGRNNARNFYHFSTVPLIVRIIFFHNSIGADFLSMRRWAQCGA